MADKEALEKDTFLKSICKYFLSMTILCKRSSVKWLIGNIEVRRLIVSVGFYCHNS